MNYQTGYRSAMTEPTLMGADEGLQVKQREPRTIVEMLGAIRDDAFRLEKQVEELNMILQPVLKHDSTLKRHVESERDQSVNISSEMFNASADVHNLLRLLSEKIDTLSSRIQL